MPLEPADVADMLTKASATDKNMIVDEGAVMGWFDAVQDMPRLDRATALAAVTEHYKVSRYTMMPADFREAVKRVRGLQESAAARQRALEGPKESGPGFEKALGSHLNDPEFQRIRMEDRVRWCETHGVEHDGDGWTVRDRPTTAREGRVTALGDFGRF